MATAQPTPQELKAKAASYRKQAEDKSLPQSVRNQFLDNANDLEAKASGVKLAKGGAVAKKKSISEYGGREKYASKAAMAKHEKGEGSAMEKKEKAAMKKAAGVAIVIGVGKPKAMAKGGMAKKGKC